MNQYFIKSENSAPLVILILMICIHFVMHFNVFQTELIGFHVWRQTETQTVINNLADDDGSLLDPRVNNMGYENRSLRKEFPLMQWLFACTQNLTGSEIASSRISSFIIGIGTLLFIFLWFQILLKHSFIAALGTWCFSFSPSFYYYLVCPMPDNLALMLGVAGLWAVTRWSQNNSRIFLILTAMLFGLSTLVKLPFVLFLIYPGILIIQESRKNKGISNFVINALIMLAGLIPAFLWYVSVIPGWKGNGIVQGALSGDYSLRDWTEYLIHNTISVLPELVLNYGSVLFFLTGLIFIFYRKSYSFDYFWPLFWTGLGTIVYFLFELNMIKKVHDYYLFPMFPFIFLIVGIGIKTLWGKKKRTWRIFTLMLVAILPLLAYLRIQQRWNLEKDPGFNPVFVDHKETLRGIIPEDALVITGNDYSTFINLYYLDRKGWVYSDNILSASQLDAMIDLGAKYLVCDSPEICENSELQIYFKEEVWSHPKLRVFSLHKQ